MLSETPDARETLLLADAIRLAVDNAAAGQLPFGALVFRDGEVLATGVNTARRDTDPTAHAEVAAVRAACRALGTEDLTGATVVSSCEPCAMCHAVCAAVGVSRILYAAAKEDVPDLGGAARPLLVQMQVALRGLDPGEIRQVPVDGHREPFRRYLEVVGER